ncbi:MAG: serine/threonine-protein kinase, partial [Bacteroidota bacterium]|nr:serine/threonine-protein kinase [Bacteroidota bacterium]
MINQIINNYKILEVLGEGGMGIVYKAFDLKLERFAALKVLSGQALSNSRFIERFRIEARNQAKLIHTNIIPVFSFIEEEGIYAIVMEFVDGITLEQLIAKKGRLSIDEATTIMLDILEGVSYAHKKGFIHRDLKPSNIIINRENIIKIMDFGISKSIYENKGLTKTGTKLGTLLYMSPEQIKAVEPTKQRDIYSLGVIFYEMLAGKNPFESGTDFDIMEAHLKKYPSKLSTIRKDVP